MFCSRLECQSLAEERGIHFHSSFDLDEETKYSSVFRGVDDSGYDENEDIWDSENIDTFGDVLDSVVNKEDTGKHMLFEQNVSSKSSEKGLSADATAYAPSKAQEIMSCSEISDEGAKTVDIHETTTQPANTSVSSTSESGNVASSASAPGLSPSSSMNSLNSEKSTLNPHAKNLVVL